MKARIFILQGQNALAKEISSLLRDEIHRDIDVEYVEIDPKYNRSSDWNMHRHCRDYLQLLRTSFVASHTFDVVIKNDWETKWCYLGLGYAGEFGGYCFELKHMQMTALFPALAVMDRIVMLPEEFFLNLDVHPRTFLSLARPLDLGGIELVDYHAAGTIKQAVHRVAIQLRREWRGLCHRQMAIRRLFKPDFVELGRLLKVDPVILESNNLFSPEVRLGASIVEGEAVEGTLSRVVLELRNYGGRALRNIRVRVRAPIKAMASPVSEMLDLLPPQTLRIELNLTPRVTPCCPLEVFVDHGDEPQDIPSFPITVLVDVSPRDPAPG
ncbi:MAG: hypothetical protein WA081_14865 [Desulfosalsimonadaceae bacterium]